MTARKIGLIVLGVLVSIPILKKDQSKMSDLNLLNRTTCMVYIRGVIMGYTLGTYDMTKSIMKDDVTISDPTLHKLRGFCLPVNYDYTQLGLVLVKYMEVNPEILHVDSSYLIVAALKKYFPCKQ